MYSALTRQSISDQEVLDLSIALVSESCPHCKQPVYHILITDREGRTEYSDLEQAHTSSEAAHAALPGVAHDVFYRRESELAHQAARGAIY